MLFPKVVCVGANLESEMVLKFLIDNNVNVVGLITLPAGASRGVSDYRDLHQLAHDAEIAVIDTEDINTVSTINSVKELKADYIFVLGWSQVLREELMSSVSCFVVGSHPSPLPKRRGRAPIPWTILENAKHSAVSLFKMTRGIDDGHILMQKSFDIPNRANSMDVYLIAAKALSEGFVELYAKLFNGALEEKPQTTEEATYRGKRIPQDGYIDFNSALVDVDRLVRAVSKPYPGAYFFYNDQRVIVWRSDLYSGPERIGVAGQIVAKQDDGLVVSLPNNSIVLKDFEINKKPVHVSQFKVGEILNYRFADEIHQLRQRISRLEEILASGETFSDE
jgi:methionyl-tRNA formyltransferase